MQDMTMSEVISAGTSDELSTGERLQLFAALEAPDIPDN